MTHYGIVLVKQASHSIASKAMNEPHQTLLMGKYTSLIILVVHDVDCHVTTVLHVDILGYKGAY